MRLKRIDGKFLGVLATDCLLFIFSLYFSNLIRFDFDIPYPFWLQLRQIFLAAIVIKIVFFFFFGLYDGMWRYTSVADLVNIIRASSLSSLSIICLILFIYRFQMFSRSVFIIDWMLTICLTAGFRLLVRFYYERISVDPGISNFFSDIAAFVKRKPDRKKRLIIIGAGDCGETIFREIKSNAQLGFFVIGFLDDQKRKHGRKIHGVGVLGSIAEVASHTKKLQVDELLIAIPSANSEQMRRIVGYCKETGLPHKTVPGYGELIDGRVTVNAIRDVAYRDLLGREIIKLDQEKIGAYLNDQTVLVTGAGGSIGSELCRQVCRFAPKRLVALDKAESPLYDIELELKSSFPQVQVVPVLADIQDPGQIEKAFDRHQPQTIFHAAAYKHVPMLELQPWKALDNNIMGTLNMVDLSEKFGVDRFVFVSTDKAVRPTNVMGASKRLAEMLVQNRSRRPSSRTRFMIVRFGNVVGSVGSVVPLFKKQIAAGGPVTVTHPEVTRYFMMIPEACQLILQAGAMLKGDGGEIYILDMGTPIKIADMARDLIRFSGFIPDEDIKIDYVGLRPGEKLYEELITEGEGIVPTSHEKIMVLRGGEQADDLLEKRVRELKVLVNAQEKPAIVNWLKANVPEYTPTS